MNRLRQTLWIVVAAVFLHLGAQMFFRPAPVKTRPAPPADAYKAWLADDGSAVRILQFYANTGVVIEGEEAVVCYGVQNARAVRLEPPVEDLKPAVNRCFAVAPERTTTYRLVAQGADGAEVSAAFSLKVKPAPPRILFVELSGREIRRGAPLTFCYGLKNASAARLEPLKMNLSPVEKACYRIFPPRTTRYMLVAEGAAGQTDRERFTVAVR